MTETHCKDWGGGYRSETDHNDWKYQGLPTAGSISWFACETTAAPTTEPTPQDFARDMGMLRHSFRFSAMRIQNLSSMTGVTAVNFHFSSKTEKLYFVLLFA